MAGGLEVGWVESFPEVKIDMFVCHFLRYSFNSKFCRGEVERRGKSVIVMMTMQGSVEKKASRA